VSLAEDDLKQRRMEHRWYRFVGERLEACLRIDDGSFPVTLFRA
jgi:hypothetical protein